jgi:flagellar basal body P-ring formation protein FlgA
MEIQLARKLFWSFIISILTFSFLLFYVNTTMANEADLMQTIRVEEIERRGTEFLWDRISEEEDNFEIKAIFPGRDVILPKGKVDFEFEILGRSQRFRAPRIPLLLNIRVDGELKRTLRLNSKAKFFKEVLKSARQLKKGSVITPEDLTLVQVDALRVGKRAFNDPEEVIGLMTVRDIRKGHILKLNMVKKPAVVKRGDRVLILAKMGAMKITAPGVVREKGFKGSMIRVQNIQSKKEVYGRVIDSNTIEVNF